MKIKNSAPLYKYQVKEYRNSVIVYYIVITLLLVLMIIQSYVSLKNGDSIRISTSLDLTTAVFLFVTALCTFTETFGLSLQNGFTRKTYFFNRVMSMLSAAVVMSLIEMIILTVVRAITKSIHTIVIESFFIQIYLAEDLAAQAPLTFGNLMVNLLCDVSLYLFLLFAGNFIVCMYYRLNKNGKLIVSLTVPGAIVLSTLWNPLIGKYRLYTHIGNFFYFAFGLAKRQYINAVITFLIGAAIFAIGAWLIIRRTPLKEK